ncbi:hypothetical protein [Bradyrhizobium australafricanum]|uniref:hypothetical protein n=1 Tax=Bradyrhizobium australafricanum TaxID=2821406 RepID=UPI001CE26655|nr:hypothetical protein [Bradyrhizobium australafricanum]MCA6104570.1 hypothetical protein [Bradyrhizobium australafricanum]
MATLAAPLLTWAPSCPHVGSACRATDEILFGVFAQNPSGVGAPSQSVLFGNRRRARSNISEFGSSDFDKNDAAQELQFRFTTDASDEAATMMKKARRGRRGSASNFWVSMRSSRSSMQRRHSTPVPRSNSFSRTEISSTADEKTRSYPQKDREIAATNMASIASYSFDWWKAPTEFL